VSERHARIVAEATDLCWKATAYGETDDGDVRAYLLPKGVVHRLVGALQGAGYTASLRNERTHDGSDEALAAMEATRDLADEITQSAALAWQATRQELDGVRLRIAALHHKGTSASPTRGITQRDCAECGQPYPCNTIRAAARP
jgi:hypothetical protein